MKRKLLVLLLAFSMVLPMLSGLAFITAAAELPDQNASGTASIDGGTTSTSFLSALQTVPAGGTVTLLSDIRLTSAVTLNRDIKINGNGRTITYTGTECAFSVSGNVAIKNLTIDAASGGGFAVTGGSLALGERDVKESVVKVTASGMGAGTSPIFTNGNNKSVVNLYYAELSGFKRVLELGSGQYEVNFYDGTYTMTCEESDVASGEIDSTGGRFIQTYSVNSSAANPVKNINFYGGNFISHFGYCFNFTATGLVVNINGGHFSHVGSGELRFMLLKSNAQLNIYNGIFYIPEMTTPFGMDYTESGGAMINAYGGTVICRGNYPFTKSKELPSPNIYGFTLVDEETLSDVDLLGYRPVIRTGASVSLDPEVPGIKFTATMPTHAITSLNAVKDAGTQLSYGMLIAPTSRLADDLPILNFDIAEYLDLKKGADYTDITAASTETNQYGDTTFSAALTGIDEKYFTLDYSAAPYVKYIKNGQEVYLFANFSEANTRNMKDIATRALADHDEHDRGYNAKQLEALENYADAEYVENDTSVTRVMSLNVLTTDASNGYTFYSGQGQSDYTFAKRLKYVQAAFDYADPDVVLFQEYSGRSFWGTAVTLNGTGGRYTSPQFPGYEWVNYGNRRGTLYENNTQSTNAFHAHNFVLYSTEKFEHISSGTRYVSKSGTYDHTSADLMFNNADGSQIMHDDLGDFTWVVLRDKETGLVSIYASIHTYTNGKNSRYAYFLDNLQCVTSFLQTVSEANGNAPVMLGGDFNMPVYGETLQPHYAHMIGAANYTDSKITGSDSGTARNFGGSTAPRAGTANNDVRIDYIFANGADTYGYEALSGQIVGGAYDPYAKIGTSTAASEGYDISDHMPIMTDVIIRRGQAYEKENAADHYVNPDTKDDRIIDNAQGGTGSATKVVCNSEDIRSRVSNLSSEHGAQYMDAKIVVDSEKGNVLRLAATDETNFVNIAFNYGGKYTTNLSGYSKIRITFMTEMAYGTDLEFCATTGSAGLLSGAKAAIPAGNDGVWQTVDINVSSVSGNLANVGIYGRGEQTGLLKGDAIYIASIELIP